MLLRTERDCRFSSCPPALQGTQGLIWLLFVELLERPTWKKLHRFFPLFGRFVALVCHPILLFSFSYHFLKYYIFLPDLLLAQGEFQNLSLLRLTPRHLRLHCRLISSCRRNEGHRFRRPPAIKIKPQRQRLPLSLARHSAYLMYATAND